MRALTLLILLNCYPQKTKPHFFITRYQAKFLTRYQARYQRMKILSWWAFCQEWLSLYISLCYHFIYVWKLNVFCFEHLGMRIFILPLLPIYNILTTINMWQKLSFVYQKRLVLIKQNFQIKLFDSSKPNVEHYKEKILRI